MTQMSSLAHMQATALTPRRRLAYFWGPPAALSFVAIFVPVEILFLPTSILTHVGSFLSDPALVYGIIFGGVGLAKRSERKAWRKLVPSLAYGPETPTGGFTVWVAEKEAGKDGTLHFRAVPYSWGWNTQGSFRKVTWMSEVSFPGLKTQWSAEASVDEVASAWFDFGQAVRQLNADYWQEFQEKTAKDDAELALSSEKHRAALSLAAVLPEPER